MHDQRPGEQARFCKIFAFRVAFGVFRDEIPVGLLCSPPFFRTRIFFVEGGVYRFMEYRFLKIMIADPGLYIFRIQDEEMPLTLTKGGFITTVDHHMMQLFAHEGRQLANSLGGRHDRFNCLFL